MIIERLPYDELVNNYKSISDLNKKYVKEISNLHSIIKEVREYMVRKDICIDTRKTDGSMGYIDLQYDILKILDKAKEK